jgi:hypothetical protein
MLKLIMKLIIFKSIRIVVVVVVTGGALPRANFVLLQAKKFPADTVPPATSTTRSIRDIVQPESDIRKGRLTTNL